MAKTANCIGSAMIGLTAERTLDRASRRAAATA
jgi:hypothetical protein